MFRELPVGSLQIESASQASRPIVTTLPTKHTPKAKSTGGSMLPMSLRQFAVFSPVGTVFAGLLLLAFVSVFWRWFFNQHQHSSGKLEDWGHAYAIPFISLYLIWMRRAELVKLPISTFWPGLAPFVLGMVSYFFCVVGVKNHMLQGFSMILSLFGLLLLLLGPAMMRVLFLPTAFLVFGVTLAEKVMINITFQLQLVASKGAWVLLSLLGPLLGYRVEVNGNTLEMLTNSGTSIPLNVAEACSGMRMVIAFIALGAAVALISCRHWWQRVALLLLAAPVAVFMNVIRVAVLGLLSLIDPQLAGGDFHMAIGTLLLIPGLGLFLAIVWALNKAVSESDDGKVPHKHPVPVAPMTAAWLRRPAFMTAVALMALVGFGMSAGIQAAGIYLQKLPIYPPGGRLLAKLPIKTSNWERIGSDRIESPEVVQELGTDNYVSRVMERVDMRNTDHRMFVDFHAAYYTGMIDTVPHVPDRCFVGGGMQIVKDWGLVEIPLDQSGWSEDELASGALNRKVLRQRTSYTEGVSEIPGTAVRLPFEPQNLRMKVMEFANPKNENQRLFAGYFFIANGGIAPTAEDVRVLAFDLSNDYAYYCKVQFTSQTVTSAPQLAAQAADLLREMLPEVMRCVPDWTQVQTGEYPENNPRKKKLAAEAVGR